MPDSTHPSPAQQASPYREEARGCESDRGTDAKPTPPPITLLLTHFRSGPVQVASSLPGRQPGARAPCQAARRSLTCACLPVTLPSFINAAICGIKTSLSYLHLAAGCREPWKGRGEVPMAPVGSRYLPGPSCPPDSAGGELLWTRKPFPGTKGGRGGCR